MNSYILNTPLRSSADQAMPFLWRKAEGYLDLGGKGYTVKKIQCNGQDPQSVTLLEDELEQPIWKTTLKVISYVIFVFPLLAHLIRGCYRSNYDFYLEGKGTKVYDPKFTERIRNFFNPPVPIGTAVSAELTKNSIETPEQIRALEEKSRVIDLENHQNGRPFRMVDGEKKIFTFEDYSKYLNIKTRIKDRIDLFEKEYIQAAIKPNKEAIDLLANLIEESHRLAKEINAYTFVELKTGPILQQMGKTGNIKTQIQLIKRLKTEADELKVSLELLARTYLS